MKARISPRCFLGFVPPSDQEMRSIIQKAGFPFSGDTRHDRQPLTPSSCYIELENHREDEFGYTIGVAFPVLLVVLCSTTACFGSYCESSSYENVDALMAVPAMPALMRCDICTRYIYISLTHCVEYVRQKERGEQTRVIQDRALLVAGEKPAPKQPKSYTPRCLKTSVCHC